MWDDLHAFAMDYAYRGGSLYQPTYLGRRDDITAAQCRMEQLNFLPG